VEYCIITTAEVLAHIFPTAQRYPVSLDHLPETDGVDREDGDSKWLSE
jgi:hypothetical protein